MQARGVSYAPVTDGFTASTAVVDQTAACACTTDGKSGSTLLGANLAGCTQHGLNMGDTDFYCYVQGGRDCTAATPSDAYPGTAHVQHLLQPCLAPAAFLEVLPQWHCDSTLRCR